MQHLNDILTTIQSTETATINAWAGLAAILVAGFAVWVIYRVNHRGPS